MTESKGFFPAGVSDTRSRIRDLMKANGMTQAQLAQRIGSSVSSLSRYFSRQTDKLSCDHIIAMAKVFGVSTDYLYGNTEIEKPADQLMDRDFISLQRARQNMSGEEWAQAMKIIRAGFAAAFGDDDQ